MIREITQEAEIGALYVGVVKRIVDFGAFVEIFPGTDGLIHISHLANERVDKVTDVVQEGDEVLVRVIDVDRAGKIRLSRKEALVLLVNWGQEPFAVRRGGPDRAARRGPRRAGVVRRRRGARRHRPGRRRLRVDRALTTVSGAPRG
jgi:transcriptional accessory protein Tex/SPT6